jgi:DNA invertase Pin-like site-specific DNA recombinase
MAKKYVSWRRVSTKKQGGSGLGLESQKEIIRYFIARDGGDWIADYEECYTGTDLSGCAELKKAMDFARENNAVLIIAKTDRFRNTIEALQVYDRMGDGNIMFCDLPHTDKFTLTLFFALAEREALIVSIRTKQALDAKKARGEKTGGASDAWIESFSKKSKEQIDKEYMIKGKMKNERYLESKDVKVFLKIIKNVFPDACKHDDAMDWDWRRVTTRGDYRRQILDLMKTHKELDESGTLFARWDFSDLSSEKLRVRLCGNIQNVRKSLEYNRRVNDNGNKES